MSSTYEFDTDRVAGSGIVIFGTAGENLGNRKLVYMDPAGAWQLADADLAAELPVLGLTLAATNSRRRVKILLKGYVGDPAWAWVVGNEIYASSTPGELTQVAAGLVQIVGVAGPSTDFVYFNSDLNTGAAPVVCALLEGAAAYVGFDACKGGLHTNYFTCDGVADHVQLQQAIDYVEALGNGVICLERGNYSQDVMLTVTNDHVHIMGKGLVNIVANAAMVAQILVTRAGFQVYDFKTENIFLDGDGNADYGIQIDGSQGVVIDNCDFIDHIDHGVYIQSTNEENNFGWITNNRFFQIPQPIRILSSVNYRTTDYVFMLNQFTRPDTVGALDAVIFCEDLQKAHFIRNYTGSADVGYQVGYGIHLRAVNHTSFDIIIDGWESEFLGTTAYEAVYCQGVGAENCFNIDVKHVGVIADMAASRFVHYKRTNNSFISSINGFGMAFASSVWIEADCNQVFLKTDGMLTPAFSFILNAGVRTRINGLGVEAAGADNPPTAASWDVGDIVRNTNDGSIWILDFTNTFRLLEGIKQVFAQVSDPNATLGRHPVVNMPDDTDTHVYAQLQIPNDYLVLVSAQVIVVAAASGNMVWTVDTDFGKLCANEDFDEHSDLSGGTDTLTQNELECIDISAALTLIAGGDLVGVDFMRNGDDGSDTIDDSVFYLGIRVRYA